MIRMPVPYNKLAIRCGVPFKRSKIAWISSRFNTTGKRLGALACSTLSNHGNSIANTSLQKQQSGLGLILRGRRHHTFDRHMSKKPLHFTSAQVTRIPLVKIQNITFNPNVYAGLVRIL